MRFLDRVLSDSQSLRFLNYMFEMWTMEHAVGSGMQLSVGEDEEAYRD